MKHVLCTITLCVALSLTHSAYAQSADDFTGYWYSEDDASIVEVTKVSGKYSGKIIWLEEPRYDKEDDDAGKLKFDRENPDKKKRKNPIIGLNILEGFTFDADESNWSGGTIYDPEKGKSYKCEIKIESDPKWWDGKKLYVRGYIGIPTLGRTTYWHRVSTADLEKYELIPKEEKE